MPKLIISTAAVAVSLYALYWVVRPQPAQPDRASFLAVTLAMTLLAYRPLAALAQVALVHPLVVFDDFARRVVRPTEVGRRTLVAGDRRMPLFEAAGEPAHLVLSVRR